MEVSGSTPGTTPHFAEESKAPQAPNKSPYFDESISSMDSMAWLASPDSRTLLMLPTSQKGTVWKRGWKEEEERNGRNGKAGEGID